MDSNVRPARLDDALSALRAEWACGRLAWICRARGIPIGHVAHQLRVSHDTASAWADEEVPHDRVGEAARIVGVSAEWLADGTISDGAMAAAEAVAARMTVEDPDVWARTIGGIVCGEVKPLCVRAWGAA
jgi:hypothetical protein